MLVSSSLTVSLSRRPFSTRSSLPDEKSTDKHVCRQTPSNAKDFSESQFEHLEELGWPLPARPTEEQFRTKLCSSRPATARIHTRQREGLVGIYFNTNGVSTLWLQQSHQITKSQGHLKPPNGTLLHTFVIVGPVRQKVSNGKGECIVVWRITRESEVLASYTHCHLLI